MANPQKENGFAPVANEILEALMRTHFSSTEGPIILWVIRNTYGYKGRYVAKFSWALIARHINASERHVRRVGTRLVKDKVIFIGSEGGIGFQKDYDEWVHCVPPMPTLSGHSRPTDGAQRTRKGGHRRPIAAVEPKDSKEIIKDITPKPSFKQFESSGQIERREELERAWAADAEIQENNRIQKERRKNMAEEDAKYGVQTKLTPEQKKKLFDMARPRKI